jgi:hypothetical protein
MPVDERGGERNQKTRKTETVIPAHLTTVPLYFMSGLRHYDCAFFVLFVRLRDWWSYGGNLTFSRRTSSSLSPAELGLTVLLALRVAGRVLLRLFQTEIGHS